MAKRRPGAKAPAYGVEECCGRVPESCRCVDLETGFAMQRRCLCGALYGDHKSEARGALPSCPGSFPVVPGESFPVFCPEVGRPRTWEFPRGAGMTPEDLEALTGIPAERSRAVHNAWRRLWLP